ncbi:hypothetical protein [Streptomyces sp. WM6378]|uniref:hypothetical protein n=1 Tax=Streptomyces sp. WM6378 TaxID=1415557 RepID=UPI0006AF4433|nr:hypothetical protein [Streptomyces sp. WM6378]KOU43548.1 hypothetical protein ADK54_17240 [Streptomyces sp. WM6378]
MNTTSPSWSDGATRLPPKTVHLRTGWGWRAASREHPLIGLDADRAPVPLTPADGHLLLVAPGGHGATDLLRTLGAQALAGGQRVDILDVHHRAHSWARGLDGVRLVEDPERLHRHLLGLAHQARSRAGAGVPGARRLVLVENDGTTQALLRSSADPRPNGTALDALTAVLAHGRLAGIQVVFACRELPPPLRHIGRDLFTTRLLAEPAACTWQWTGPPGAAAPACHSSRPGLWHHLSPAGLRLVQAAHISDTDAAALSRPAPAPSRAAGPTKESHL